jgi:hypothetical protein
MKKTNALILKMQDKVHTKYEKNQSTPIFPHFPHSIHKTHPRTLPTFPTESSLSKSKKGEISQNSTQMAVLIMNAAENPIPIPWLQSA